MEYRYVRYGLWRGLNGKLYPLRWGGNQFTGGRIIAKTSAVSFKIVGRAAFAVGAVNSAYQAYQGNISKTKAGFDIGFGFVGLFGPSGFTINAIYSVVDLTVGWPRVGQQLAAGCDAGCQMRRDNYWKK